MTQNLRDLVTQEQFSKNRERILRQIIVSSISTFQTNKVLKSAVIEIGKLFNATRCYFIRYDNEINDFLPIKDYETYISSIEYTDVSGLKINKERLLPFIKVLMDQNEIITVTNIAKSKISEETINLFNQYQIKSFMAAPALFLNKFLGIFVIDFDNEHREFSQDEINLLKTVATQSAAVIYQTELFAETQKAREREELIRRIVSTVRVTLNTEKMLELVLTEIAKVFDVQRITVSEIQILSDKNIWDIKKEFKTSSDIKGIIDTHFDKRIEEYNANEILKNGKLVIEDISSADVPDYYKEFYEALNVKSIIITAIKQGNDIWGAIALSDKNVKRWKKEEIGMLETISDQIFIAIKQAELYEFTQKQSIRAELIRNIISAIGGSLDINEVLKIICSETLRLYKVNRVSIESYTIPGDYSKWTIPMELKSDPSIIGVRDIDYPDESKIYIGKTVLDKDKSIVVSDMRTSSCPESVKLAYNMMNTGGLLIVPIKKGEDKYGILALSQTQPRNWTQEEILLLHTIADQAYIAIRQAELYSSTKKLADRENLLRTIINEILLSESLEEVSEKTCKEIVEIFGVDRVGIRFFDIAQQKFSHVMGEYKKNESIPTSYDEGMYTDAFDRFLIDTLFNKRKPLIINNINDTSNLPIFALEELKSFKVKSTIAIPLSYKNYPQGVLYISNTETYRSWTNEEISLATSIGQQISIGIHLFYLNSQLSKSLNSERTVRNLILEAREADDYDTIFNFLLEKMLEIFNVERALHLHITQEGHFCVKNEAFKENGLTSLMNKNIICKNKISSLLSEDNEEVIIINNINSDIEDESIKDALKNYNIQALLIYPAHKTIKSGEEEITSSVMLCSSVPKVWASDEIDSLKLIIDTTYIVYREIMQRQETEEIKRTFLTTLTHDMRSPIIAEQKALEFIISRDKQTPLSEFMEFLDGIYKTNEELLRLVNNILSVYHYESGKFSLNLLPNDINEVIQDVVQVMIPLARSEGFDITLDIQPDIPKIVFDRDEIYRVINNLISNAIKHNRSGTSIKVNAQKLQNYVQVSVQDNGDGIPEEDRPNIFQRYPTTKRKIGTGLGLYLSKQIIDAHNGRIWFESEVNKGTTFYFTLPLQTG